MERPDIIAELRAVGSKGVNRRLRVEGKIPAVLYGHGESGRGLTINAKELGLKIRAQGENALYDLKVAGQSDAVVVMVKDFQINPLSRKLTHVDLLKINMTDKVTVKVTIHLMGKALGQTKGGIVDQARREITVRCLPTKIPHAIDVDITNLDMGHAIHLRDLKLPEGVEIPQQEANETVVSIVTVKEEKPAEVVVAPEVAAAAAAPAAGAPAAKGAAAAPAAKGGEKADKKADKK